MGYMEQIMIDIDSYKELKELSYKKETLRKNNQTIENAKKKNSINSELFLIFFHDNLSF